MPDSATELLERSPDAAGGEICPVAADPVVEDVVDTELLVEEISIDGMCGVY